MELYEYEKICKDLESGIKHFVLNTETKETGEVHMGRHGYFNVKVGQGEEVWPIDKCKEIEAETAKSKKRH